MHAAAAALPVVESAVDDLGAAAPRRLDWTATPELRKAVAGADAAFKATVGRTDLAVLRTDEFTNGAARALRRHHPRPPTRSARPLLSCAGFLKQNKLSPDGMMQLAFQLAHHKMHGGLLPSTYESASTAAFKHGRTETIRSATPEAAAFTAAFADPASTPAAREAAMRAAAENHGRITREALMGKGFDHHLFALHDLAKSEGRTPRLFECDAMARLRTIILSTSTLASEALQGGGFGPVNERCYAIGYGIRDNECGAQIMSYDRDSAQFVDCLRAAMAEMRGSLQLDAKR